MSPSICGGLIYVFLGHFLTWARLSRPDGSAKHNHWDQLFQTVPGRAEVGTGQRKEI